MNTQDIKNAFAPWKSTEIPLAKVAIESSASPVTARLNYTAVGVCPYCNSPMKKSMACGQEVFVCMEDRSVTPLPN